MRPRHTPTTLGPIAQPWHVKELEAIIADAKAKGAKVLAGGAAAAVGGRGRFFLATLLRDVPQNADVMQKEAFGPILAVAPVDSDEEALQKLNAVKNDVTAAMSKSHGLKVADLVLVAPGSLPTTTSGKVRRAASVEQYRRQGFTRVDA